MATKTVRIEARATEEQKRLIQHAADISGRKFSDFLLASAEAAALNTIRDHQVIQLTTSGTVSFVEALLNPPSTSKRMEDAARRYLEMVDRA